MDADLKFSGFRHGDLGAGILRFREEEPGRFIGRRGQTLNTVIVQTALFRGSPSFSP
jgi:hypothetical protein